MSLKNTSEKNFQGKMWFGNTLFERWPVYRREKYGSCGRSETCPPTAGGLDLVLNQVHQVPLLIREWSSWPFLPNPNRDSQLQLLVIVRHSRVKGALWGESDKLWMIDVVVWRPPNRNWSADSKPWRVNNELLIIVEMRMTQRSKRKLPHSSVTKLLSRPLHSNYRANKLPRLSVGSLPSRLLITNRSVSRATKPAPAKPSEQAGELIGMGEVHRQLVGNGLFSTLGRDSSQFLEAIIRLAGQQKLTMQNLERENERLRNQTTSDSPVQGPPVLRLSTTEGSQGALNPTQRTSVPPALATEPGQGVPSVAAQKVSAPAPSAPCDQEEPWVLWDRRNAETSFNIVAFQTRSESDKEISKLFGLDNRSFLRRPRRGKERQGETNEGHRVPPGPSAEAVGSRAGTWKY
jgi:hypothetical protein